MNKPGEKFSGLQESRAHLKRQFVEGRYGQVHLRIARPATPTQHPLICLHMSPKSGAIFARFMLHAADDRIVVAPDYPGFGESDPPPAQPQVSIADYASSMWEVVDQLSLGVVDLLGYHTGSEVAAEMARQRPDQARRIVLISAPVFTAEELDQIERTYSTIALDSAGTRFQKMWQAVLQHSGPGMTLEMAAASFAENLRAGENYEWGHRAAFAYAMQFPNVIRRLPHRITVMNPQDDLVNQTPRIADYLQNGEIINQPEWGHGFLDVRTDEAVAAIKQALDS
jgi:pimeloyl-ACP methyl ester carboxylesterase